MRHEEIINSIENLEYKVNRLEVIVKRIKGQSQDEAEDKRKKEVTLEEFMNGEAFNMIEKQSIRLVELLNYLEDLFVNDADAPKQTIK